MTTEVNDKFYTCRNDRAFKEILLNEKNEDILKKILEVSLGVSIQNIKRENVERNTGNLYVRRKRQDILLTTDQGKINIEMNASYKKYLHARNLAYQCDNYAHYTLVGEEYTEEVQIIQINFTYGIGKTDNRIVRKYFVQDDEKLFAKNFIILEYNMDKIMEFWYSKNEKEIEKYKYLIMLDLEPKDLSILSKKDKIVEEYKMTVEIINKDASFRRYISEEEDQRKCYNSDIHIARDEGIEQGLEQGAKQNSIEIAKKLLNKGFPMQDIAECTELPLEEIEKLKNNELE